MGIVLDIFFFENNGGNFPAAFYITRDGHQHMAQFYNNNNSSRSITGGQGEEELKRSAMQDVATQGIDTGAKSGAKSMRPEGENISSTLQDNINLWFMNYYIRSKVEMSLEVWTLIYTTEL